MHIYVRIRVCICMHDDVIKWKHFMMTSSNGNIFRVTGPLCGEFTGPGEFPTQRPVTRSFDVLFDLRLNKRLSKQPWGWWFETPSWSLWRQRNVSACWPFVPGINRSPVTTAESRTHNNRSMDQLKLWPFLTAPSHHGLSLLVTSAITCRLWVIYVREDNHSNV